MNGLKNEDKNSKIRRRYGKITVSHTVQELVLAILDILQTNE
ncbi:hypothetical protein KVP40.0241 [Vibrio phage KVP40]|uniref:Uncharacterized protein n=1 Tax=Vibrio phage KVP40 (isolate Vibrio parahaemolyticus/Japan/Matsuzaki/1991) TaxID=75320 RepID=Q6WHR3_BPKVM|nr:hypothetical protein KVP40.0241 [Vibrio phage KVP40]AAQ64310.1 hypothetical protein KVP40.0241 [Vibrio phage KVP40]